MHEAKQYISLRRIDLGREGTPPPRPPLRRSTTVTASGPQNPDLSPNPFLRPQTEEDVDNDDDDEEKTTAPKRPTERQSPCSPQPDRYAVAMRRRGGDGGHEGFPPLERERQMHVLPVAERTDLAGFRARLVVVMKMKTRRGCPSADDGVERHQVDRAPLWRPCLDPGAARK